MSVFRYNIDNAKNLCFDKEKYAMNGIVDTFISTLLFGKSFYSIKTAYSRKIIKNKLYKKKLENL